MQIQFKRKSQWTPSKVAIIKKATRWCSHRLGLTNLPATIVVRLVGPYSFEYGSCSMVDKTRFIVWLHDGNSLRRTLHTLFHEMTHIRQHMFEGLVLHSMDHIEFRNETHKTFNYWDSPWEREARKNEYKLYREWTHVNKK